MVIMSISTLYDNEMMMNEYFSLGPFGFLTLHNSTLEGNYAYSDALSALRWVKENIAAFGGDPERITIFVYCG